jgi:alpha-L-fucosidase
VYENDIIALRGFRKILDETFRNNLALKAKVTSPDNSPGNPNYGPQNIVDNNDKSFWITDNKKNALIEITLDALKTFDRILLQEPIHLGQRIGSFEIQVLQNKEWKTITSGTTIGYKRILRISPVQSNKIRILIKESNNAPALSNFGLYKASKEED